MNLSQRSKLSLCQFLTLFGPEDLILLLSKYKLSTEELEDQYPSCVIAAALSGAILPALASQIEGLVQELARTRDSMRASVSPRYRFDERWEDLRLCLTLDGYTKERDEYNSEPDRFVPIEPIIEGANAVEDDLTKELQRSELPDSETIIDVLDNSANAFRNVDYNGCLNNARVALQTLAKSVAQTRLSNHPDSFDDTKWGEVIAYLKRSCFITPQQEKGLAGVFGLNKPRLAHTSRVQRGGVHETGPQFRRLHVLLPRKTPQRE